MERRDSRSKYPTAMEEYLEDYASPDTARIGEALIDRELLTIPDEKVREVAEKYIRNIEGGERDFRF